VGVLLVIVGMVVECFCVVVEFMGVIGFGVFVGLYLFDENWFFVVLIDGVGMKFVFVCVCGWL